MRVWYLCLEGGQSSRRRSGDLPVKAEACHLIIWDRLGQELKLGGTFRISAQGPFPRDKSRGGGCGCVGPGNSVVIQFRETHQILHSEQDSVSFPAIPK